MIVLDDRSNERDSICELQQEITRILEIDLKNRELLCESCISFKIEELQRENTYIDQLCRSEAKFQSELLEKSMNPMMKLDNWTQLEMLKKLEEEEA